MYIVNFTALYKQSTPDIVSLDIFHSLRAISLFLSEASTPSSPATPPPPPGIASGTDTVAAAVVLVGDKPRPDAG